MDQIFHSWCMGSNLGNLEPGSSEDGDGWGGGCRVQKSIVTSSWWRFVGDLYQRQQRIVKDLYASSAVQTIKDCPEVRVCGFGSSPRFGSTVDGDWCAAAAEVWHRWGRSVGWEQCGRVGRVL